MHIFYMKKFFLSRCTLSIFINLCNNHDRCLGVYLLSANPGRTQFFFFVCCVMKRGTSDNSESSSGQNTPDNEDVCFAVVFYENAIHRSVLFIYVADKQHISDCNNRNKAFRCRHRRKFFLKKTAKAIPKKLERGIFVVSNFSAYMFTTYLLE